jgi:hypothetical protein
VTQSTAANLTVILSLASTGAPATGILFGALTVQYSQNGGAFGAKVVAAPDWTELGGGVYTLAFTAGELGVLGPLVFTVNSATTDQFVGQAMVVAAAAATTPVEVLTCTLTGYVTDMAGLPEVSAGVTARLLGVSYQGNIGLSDASVSTTTNANGQFFLTLARLAEVQVDIPSMNYSRRLTVPNSETAELFEVP